jgi:uncharacterized protein with HEPN domain
MPPTLADRLVHILEAINNIQKSMAASTPETFSNDVMLRLGVERSFEIISEASRRIPPEVKSQQSAINWQSMADLGTCSATPITAMMQKLYGTLRTATCRR